MKILLVYASFGEGHKKAAKSLEQFLDSPCKDLLDFCHPLLKEILWHSYLFITEHAPFLWSFLFVFCANKRVNAVIEKIHRLVFSSFINYLREVKPDIIISTHFSLFPIVSHIKKELGIRVFSIVTDFRVHPLWVSESVDLYFTPHEISKKDLIAEGINEGRIISGFVSLREGFLREIPRDELREKFGLDDKPCILFMSSVRGKFPFIEKLINQFSEQFNILIVYGKNLKLKKYLETVNFPSNRMFSFYEEAWELISVSSIIVTKPGGLTVFEGMYKKKLFIFPHYIPGQEQGNMELVIKYGLGRYVRNYRELTQALDYFSSKADSFKNSYPVEIKDVRNILQTILNGSEL